MTWPNSPAESTQLDSALDSPAGAREQLLGVATRLSQVIEHGDPALMPGRLIGVRVFTTAHSGSNYTPTVGTTSVIVEAVGGGGGGGYCGATTATHIKMSECGSSGSYAKVRLTSGFAGAAMVIGAGGAKGVFGVSGGDASSGGETSFGGAAVLRCPGGAGGRGESALAISTPQIYSSSAVPGFACSGTALTAAISVVNSDTGVQNCIIIMSSTNYRGLRGKAGDTPLGRGGWSGDVVSRDGTGYGSGGGAPVNASLSSGVVPGGNGAPGVIIIWEYS